MSDDPYMVLKTQRYGTSFNLDGIWGGNMYAGGAGAILPNKITSKHNFRYQPGQTGPDIVKKLQGAARQERLHGRRREADRRRAVGDDELRQRDRPRHAAHLRDHGHPAFAGPRRLGHRRRRRRGRRLLAGLHVRQRRGRREDLALQGRADRDGRRRPRRPRARRQRVLRDRRRRQGLRHGRRREGRGADDVRLRRQGAAGHGQATTTN